MYILTIYRIIDDIDILWQQASANELTLQKAAVIPTPMDDLAKSCYHEQGVSQQ